MNNWREFKNYPSNWNFHFTSFFKKAWLLPSRSVVEAEVFPTEFIEEATVEPFGRFSWSRSLSSSCCCCWNEKAIWKMSKTITRCIYLYIFFWIQNILLQKKGEIETSWSNFQSTCFIVLPNVKRRDKKNFVKGL